MNLWDQKTGAAARGFVRENAKVFRGIGPGIKEV